MGKPNIKMSFLCGNSWKNAPAYRFVLDNLLALNEANSDFYIKVHNDSKKIDYSHYNVALFMGYDVKADLAKQQNRKIITGVFDPRAGQNISFSNVDFIAVNDIEAKDYFSQFCDNDNILIYYLQPKLPPKTECPVSKEKFIIGYHGNKVHLDAMYPRITNAIERLATEIPLEFWAMSAWKDSEFWNKEKRLSFPIRYISWSQENYAKYIANVDIGVVPQLMPIKYSQLLMYFIMSFGTKFNETKNDFIFRFKETTNRGRHLVFARYGIPVISDMTPSACNFIDSDETSFLAYHTDAWYKAMRTLAHDKDRRKQMGKQFQEKYYQIASPEIQNEQLARFIRDSINNTV